jgi:phage baseplate assembly protein gpV
MRKLIAAALIGTAVFAAALLVRATPTIVAGSPAAVNNTTSNFPPTAAFTYNQAIQQWTITHSSLQQTTDISIKIMATLQNSTNNAVQIGTWYPSNTNAVTETIPASVFSPTNYVYPQISTTNSQSFYMTYGT